MKQWISASIEEINLCDTKNGGMPSRNFDQQWFDENGAIHVNFTPANPTPAPQGPGNEMGESPLS